MIDSAKNSNLDSDEAFVEAMQQFITVRSTLVEKEYYEAHSDMYNQQKRNELYDRILYVLGMNKDLMVEFADRDAACYNPDTDYFYNCGFSDCLRFLRTFKGVSNKNISLERILHFADIA